MKGIIIVKKRGYGSFRKNINVDSNGHPKKVKLRGDKGKLDVEVRSNQENQLSCIVNPDGKLTTRTLSFNFFGIKGTKSLRVNGQRSDTGKLVPWNCSFKAS